MGSRPLTTAAGFSRWEMRGRALGRVCLQHRHVPLPYLPLFNLKLKFLVTIVNLSQLYISSENKRNHSFIFCLFRLFFWHKF